MKRDPVVIGDVHGCLEELVDLIDLLTQHGYTTRDLVFAGDLVDRGPDSAGVLTLVRELVLSGGARGVMGNHDSKLVRFHRHETKVRSTGGRYRNPMRETYGHQETYQQVLNQDPSLFEFLESGALSPTTLDLGNGCLVVHAGVGGKPGKKDHDRFCQHVRFVDEKTGAMMSLGPGFTQPPGSTHWTTMVRNPSHHVFFGHDVRDLQDPQVLPLGEDSPFLAVATDTGCCFGGRLTAVATNAFLASGLDLRAPGVTFQVPSRQPLTSFRGTE